MRRAEVGYGMSRADAGFEQLPRGRMAVGKDETTMSTHCKATKPSAPKAQPEVKAMSPRSFVQSLGIVGMNGIVGAAHWYAASRPPPSSLAWVCPLAWAGLTCAAWLLVLTPAIRTEAQEIIGAEHFSGFLRGDGYGWHGATVPGLGPLRITWTAPEAMLSWPRTGMLQSASSVLGPWNDHSDAVSPCVFPLTNSPYTAPYVRDPRDSKGWRGFGYGEHGIPLWLLFEFDGAALFALEQNRPDWMQGGFAEAIQLPRRPFATPHFYVHGYLDQVGQATAPDGDPAYVFKQFGRDIAGAVKEQLLP